MRPIDADTLLDGLDENCGDLDLEYNSEYAKLVHYIDSQPTLDYEPVRHSEWKYYHKQNRAVCMACSFERDLDADFGRAISCPNCGAKMGKGDA